MLVNKRYEGAQDRRTFIIETPLTSNSDKTEEDKNAAVNGFLIISATYHPNLNSL